MEKGIISSTIGFLLGVIRVIIAVFPFLSSSNFKI